MRVLGIVGGIGPESTIDYYRSIVASYRSKRPEGGYPLVMIDSIDMTAMMNLVATGRLAALTDYLLTEVQRLATAGADFGLLAANTPHVVFEPLRQRSPIPLVSVVECACEATKTLGLDRVGLFGTRFTMQGRFFPDVFRREGIAIVTPVSAEQDYIHDRYLSELVNGIFRSETRERMLRIVDRMIEQEGIQGLILGGTELPLLLRAESYNGIALLDSTRAHVERAVAQLLA